MSVESVSTIEPQRAGILAAIRDASARTGADFDYLLSTATRESSLNAEAKAKSSSATGLFQFIDQTWLGLVKRFGGRHGLETLASAISDDGNGRYSVAADDKKAAILALRKDAGLSALMAGEAANETKKNLECALGREVCGGELYAAHFFGEGNARKLIALNEDRPECPAAEAFPAAARANPALFHHADGSQKTVREVYSWATGISQTPMMSEPPSPVATALEIPPIETRPDIKAELADGGAGREDRPIPFLRGTDNFQPALPRAPLQLSLGVLEVFAALTAPGHTVFR